MAMSVCDSILHVPSSTSFQLHEVHTTAFLPTKLGILGKKHEYYDIQNTNRTVYNDSGAQQATEADYLTYNYYSHHGAKEHEGFSKILCARNDKEPA